MTRSMLTSWALSILAVSDAPHTEKNMRPALGSRAMPRGLLTCTETAVLQRNLLAFSSLLFLSRHPFSKF